MLIFLLIFKTCSTQEAVFLFVMKIKILKIKIHGTTFHCKTDIQTLEKILWLIFVGHFQPLETQGPVFLFVMQINILKILSVGL